MNCSVYIFAQSKDNVIQYPNDYTNVILNDFIKYSNNSSQIIIHRDGDLIYYGYVRHIDANHLDNVIGFCVEFNGVICYDFDKISTIFSQVTTSLLTQSLSFFNFQEKGCRIDDFTGRSKECELVTNFITKEFNKLDFEKLPPQDFAIAKGSDFSCQLALVSHYRDKLANYTFFIIECGPSINYRTPQKQEREFKWWPLILGILIILVAVIIILSLCMRKPVSSQPFVVVNENKEEKHLVPDTVIKSPITEDIIPKDTISSKPIISIPEITPPKDDHIEPMIPKNSSDEGVNKKKKAKSEIKTQESNVKISLSYGEYIGDAILHNGRYYPNGKGKIVYNKQTIINPYDKNRIANAGDYLEGQFERGFVVAGKLYSSSGNLIGKFMIGNPTSDTYDQR